MAVVPKKLREALGQGLVVPFVGAGVSMAVRRAGSNEALFPSWPSLLLRAADRLEEEHRPEHSLVRGFLEQHTPKYLQAAQYAHDGLAAMWPDFFRVALDPLYSDANAESLALARSIWDLGSKLVLTTNYDRVLRWVSGPDTDTVSTPASARLVDVQRDVVRRRTIWHLHGSVDDPGQVILTPQGYERLYLGTSEQQFRAALETLRHLMMSRHFLFVGFSLDDEYLVALLRDVAKTFDRLSGPHYVLARQRDIPQMRQKISGIDVDFIGFEDFGAPLQACLQGLVDHARNEAPAAQPSEPEPVVEISQPRARHRNPTPKTSASATTPSVAELGRQTAAAARDNDTVVAAIAELTGRREPNVARSLRNVDGRWEDVEALGRQSAAAARQDPTLIAAVARVTGRSEDNVTRAVNQVDGRRRLHGLFASDWPEPDHGEEDEEQDEVTAWAEDLDELRAQTAAAARDDETLIAAIARVTDRSARSVARVLRQADGRARVHSLFAHDWPKDEDEEDEDDHEDEAGAEDDVGETWSAEDIDELARKTAAGARDDDDLIAAIADLTGRTVGSVAWRLRKADGRARVRSVFARDWPEDEDEDDDEPEDWSDLDALGRQTCAAARADDTLISAIAEVTERTERGVARKLRLADGRARVRSLFASDWPEDEDEDEGEDEGEDAWEDLDALGRQTAAAARDDDNVIAAIATVTGKTPRSVARKLREVDGRARVHALFARDWPEQEEGADTHTALGQQTAASVREDDDAIAEIAEITGRSRRVVARVLLDADGRYRVRTLFADDWPE